MCYFAEFEPDNCRDVAAAGIAGLDIAAAVVAAAADGVLVFRSPAES